MLSFLSILIYKMNLLFYFENVIDPTIGGTERATENVATALAVRGHNVFYMAKYHRELANVKFPTVFLPSQELLSEENILFLNKFIRERHIDVVINEGGNTSDVQLFNHRYIPQEVKVITCLHFSPYQGWGKYWLRDRLRIQSAKDVVQVLKLVRNRAKALRLLKNNYQIALHDTDKFVVLCDEFKQEIIKLTGKGIKLFNKIVTIPNINPVVATESDYLQKQNVVVWVGRLQYEIKRVDRLLKSWKNIQDDFPQWRLEILGEGADRDYYERLVNKRGIRNVVFRGRCNPTEYYKKAKIIALCSTHESFGMTLVEGMSYRCVPIAFNSYATIEEIIPNEYIGVKIKPFDIKAYADGLTYLMSQDDLDVFGEKAYKNAQRYSPIEVVGKWVDLLNN